MLIPQTTFEKLKFKHFSHLIPSLVGKKIVSKKYFFYQLGRELKEKNVQISISQKWFEISTPNFHQLLTSIGTRFVPNLKTFGASDLDFPPKMSKTLNGHGRSIF